MTIMETTTTTKEEVSEEENPEQKPNIHLHKLGGFDLISRRPLVCKQNKSLYVVSGKNVRAYSTENGSFVDEYTFANQTNIVAIQHNPACADELIVVSANGLIVYWNHVENIKTSEAFLKLDEASSTVDFFQLVGDVYYFVLTRSKGDKSTSQLFYCHKNHLSNVMAVYQSDHVNKEDASRSVAFGPTTKPEYCVAIHKHHLHVYQIPIKVKSKFRTQFQISTEKRFTCVAFHPTEPTVAAGDSIGRIVLWKNIAGPPSKTVMHWHSQQVNDMAFSPSGTYLYSVGNEKVLVKWNLVGQYFGEKTYFPRLGMPIKYVVVDPNMIITSHDDQTLHIIDSQMNGIQAVVEGLTIGFDSNGQLASGMHYNPRLASLVMNGRVGHVQLYSPALQKQLFQLDVVNQNLVSEVNKQSLEDRLSKKSTDKQLNKVYPIEVTKLAVSSDGYWMATVEFRDDHETLPEIRLKFWRLQKKNSNFSLNTTIHLPHQEEVTFIAFSPASDDGNSLHLVSTSKDKSFKIWDLNVDVEKRWWNCSRNASLNSHSVPRAASFSWDSSLLTVLFDNIVTLWELDTPTSIRYIPRMDIFTLNQSANSHKNKKKNSSLIYLGFGAHKYANYLIEGYNRQVVVLNILRKFEPVFTCKCPLKGQEKWTSMTFSPNENALALLSTSGIQFLSLQTQNIVMQINFADIANFTGTVVSSVFTSEASPSTNKKYPKLPFDRFSFYCLNEKHELFRATIADNEQVYEENIVLVGNEESRKTKLYMQHVQNQLSLMLTNKSKATSATEDKVVTGGSVSNFEQNRKTLVDKFFYNVPSHVLPPVSMFEKSFLTSYLECLNISNGSTTTSSTTDSAVNQPTAAVSQLPELRIDNSSLHDADSSTTPRVYKNLSELKTLLDRAESNEEQNKNELITENRFGFIAKCFES